MTREKEEKRERESLPKRKREKERERGVSLPKRKRERKKERESLSSEKEEREKERERRERRVRHGSKPIDNQVPKQNKKKSFPPPISPCSSFLSLSRPSSGSHDASPAYFATLCQHNCQGRSKQVFSFSPSSLLLPLPLCGQPLLSLPPFSLPPPPTSLLFDFDASIDSPSHWITGEIRNRLVSSRHEKGARYRRRRS